MSTSIPPITHPRSAVTGAFPKSDNSPRNKILRLLPPAELAALVGRSDLVEVKSKQVFWEPEQQLEYAYFPEDCVISLVTVMEDGD
jgi:hypothetical protein